MDAEDARPGMAGGQEKTAADRGSSPDKTKPLGNVKKMEELAITPGPNPREEVLLRIRAAEREAAERRKAAEERAASIVAEARRKADGMLESADAEGRKLVRTLVEQCLVRYREERRKRLEAAESEAREMEESIGSTAGAVEMVLEQLRREYGVQA